MKSAVGRVIAGCFALSAFAVAIFAGLASQNATAQILLRAVLAMIVCYPVGLLIGWVCEWVVAGHVLTDDPGLSVKAPISAASAADGRKPVAEGQDEEVVVV